jgi:uncharacterized membrane protein
MNGLLHQFELMARSRIGVGTSVVVWLVIAIVALLAAIVFADVALFVWLYGLYGAQIASLILFGGFLLVAIVAALIGLAARRQRMQRARLELAASRGTGLLDTRFLSVGLEIGRALGWRRIVTLAAAGLFTAGLAREWSERRRAPDPAAPE